METSTAQVKRGLEPECSWKMDLGITSTQVKLEIMKENQKMKLRRSIVGVSEIKRVGFQGLDIVQG